MNRKMVLGEMEVDNPYFAADHPENVSNPRKMKALVNRKADPITAMAHDELIDPHQKKAADQFADLWDTREGNRRGGLHEHVDMRRSSSIADAVVDAGKELALCKVVLGEYLYPLVENVCGKRYYIADMFPLTLPSRQATVRLQRRIAHHNLRVALDLLAGRWGHMHRKVAIDMETHLER